MGARAKSKTSSRRPARRTNAERSAETRAKLISAAVEVLYDSGYSAATTIEVARRARVSRGAMLHHFPTRVDLLLASAEHIILEQRRETTEKLGRYAEGWERFAAAAEVSWEVQSQPATIALLEIMLATRSDPDLRKGLAPLLREMAASRAERAARLAHSLGVADVNGVQEMILVHLAALHGLTMNLMFTQNRQEVDEARTLLTHFEQTFIRQLMPKPATGRDGERGPQE